MDTIFIAMDEGVNSNVLNNIRQDLRNEIPGHENRRPQNENYFEITIPRYTDIQFIEHFRMLRNTFQVYTFIMSFIIIQ